MSERNCYYLGLATTERDMDSIWSLHDVAEKPQTVIIRDRERILDAVKNELFVILKKQNRVIAAAGCYLYKNEGHDETSEQLGIMPDQIIGGIDDIVASPDVRRKPIATLFEDAQAMLLLGFAQKQQLALVVKFGTENGAANQQTTSRWKTTDPDGAFNQYVRSGLTRHGFVCPEQGLLLSDTRASLSSGARKLKDVHGKPLALHSSSQEDVIKIDRRISGIAKHVVDKIFIIRPADPGYLHNWSYIASKLLPA